MALSIARCCATEAYADQVLAAITRAGTDVGALARRLQDEGAKGFVDSWKELLGAIETKRKALA
jgi:transaldolase